MNFELGDADALLMVGASEQVADLYYATHFRAPDPFAFVWTAREKLIMVNPLELDRARQQAEVDRVVAYPHYEERARQAGIDAPDGEQVLRALLGDLGLEHLLVPGEFPLRTADFLRGAGLRLSVAPSPLFAGRQIKSEAEIAAIALAQQAAEAGMQAAVDMLGAAGIDGGVLVYEGAPLSSERVRRAIHQALLERDCTGRHTIVAGGEQACDPHEEGHGLLRAGEPIIIDIFPCHDHSGYFGDITRTFVKGAASEPVQRLYEAVRRAQEMALECVRAGAEGRAIHRQVQQFFADSGYETGERDGYMQGFFHGTGHGLGLEIHERPRLAARGQLLEEGHVVTVEPGLYYRGLGGVRIEDTVVVRRDGCQNLTGFAKELIVP